MNGNELRCWTDVDEKWGMKRECECECESEIVKSFQRDEKNIQIKYSNYFKITFASLCQFHIPYSLFRSIFTKLKTENFRAKERKKWRASSSFEQLPIQSTVQSNPIQSHSICLTQYGMQERSWVSNLESRV